MSDPFSPAYLSLLAGGELERRARTARERLADCRLCPRECRVNRLAGEKGVCRTGGFAVVASHGPHFGEEDVLVGSGGSGTIFFSHCNLGCVFCQNWEISHLGEGREVAPEELASMMISLQEKGCHNINLVTPSHVAAQVLEALVLASAKGLTLPIVYNSSGYDAVETLRLLDGVVDIYMPDFKFWSQESARRLCKAPDYPAKARAAIREMHRQVGDLLTGPANIARRGLLVRHLVMPGGLEETREILAFLAREISANTFVNVMEQYHPCGQAHKYPSIDRSLTRQEYLAALDLAREAGLSRLAGSGVSRLLRRLFAE